MAVERTLLFRLAQDDFYSLMSEQPLILAQLTARFARSSATRKVPSRVSTLSGCDTRGHLS